MKHSILFYIFGGTLFTLGALRSAATEPVVLGSVDGIPYRINTWDHELGNHRIVVDVASGTNAVVAEMLWRRRDPQAARWDIVVMDPKGKRVNNRKVLKSTPQSCTVVFSARSGKGAYAIYYLKPNADFLPENAWRSQKKLGLNHLPHFPTIMYDEYKETASETWLKSIEGKAGLPKAKVVAFEALERMGPDLLKNHNSFYPMELTVTRAERNKLVLRGNKTFALFPELREYPIRMFDKLPYRWTTPEYNADALVDSAKQNEFLVFQIAVFAKQDLKDVKIAFSDLVSTFGKLPKTILNSFNHGGNDWLGRPFTKQVSVLKNKIQPLWIGLDIPRDAKPGRYRGKVTVTADGSRQSLPIDVTIQKGVLEDRGDSDINSLSRLRWLDSTIGIDDEVIAPYTPVKKTNNVLEILGRRVQLAASGLPAQAESFIDMEEIRKTGRAILKRPIDLKLQTGDGPVPLKFNKIRYTKTSPNETRFEVTGAAPGLAAVYTGTLESDGYMRYKLKFTANKLLNLTNARLDIPMPAGVAKYTAGKFGAGYVPKPRKTAIKGGLMYQAFWAGDYNAGIGLWLKNAEDEWNGDNKSKGKVPMVAQWANDGKGSYEISKTADTTTFSVQSGELKLSKGQSVEFDFCLLITPFKPLTDFRWKKRIYHPSYSSMPQERWAKTANIVNLHHATKLNPYINYPFLSDTELKPYVEHSHKQGRKVKLYNTVRELSVFLPELWMLRSLGNEIFMPDRGFQTLSKKDLKLQKERWVRSGSAWMAEHLVDNYRTRWQGHIRRDAQREKLLGIELDNAIATQGLSRWHNYYLEGLKYLVDSKNVGIDGIYLDGIGYDRDIMKRVRKTMGSTGKETQIDFHGAVHFAWLTHAPYVDSIWFGEGAQYNRGADYWLVEVSGLPFGLPGEILHGLRDRRHGNVDIANHFKGMVFGISRRMGWNGVNISCHLWKFWDEFGIENARQYGFWMNNTPVVSSHDDVKVGVYVNKGKTFLAIANFGRKAAETTLTIDWKTLGLNPDAVTIQKPSIKDHQKAGKIDLTKPIAVPGDGGMFVLIEAKK